MKIKPYLIFILAFLGVTANAKPENKPIVPVIEKSVAHKHSSPLYNDGSSNPELQLQALQGDWLCRSTFHFENNKLKQNVVRFSYDNIDNNTWRSQGLDDITVSMLIDKKWETGQARVIVRSKSVIQKIAGSIIYEQLTNLDEEEWISYDDNLAGKYIREVFFAEADRLTRNLMEKQTPSRYQIELLDENTLQYTTLDFSPATDTTCHRLKLIP